MRSSPRPSGHTGGPPGGLPVSQSDWQVSLSVLLLSRVLPRAYTLPLGGESSGRSGGRAARVCGKKVELSLPGQLRGVGRLKIMDALPQHLQVCDPRFDTPKRRLQFLAKMWTDRLSGVGHIEYCDFVDLLQRQAE